MSGLSAAEAESLFYAFLTLFGGEFANFDNINIHGVRVSNFGGSGEGLVGLMSGFGVSFRDFIGVLPLGLEGDDLLVPVVDGGGDCVHGHDLAHEGREDASREVSNKDILVGDASKGGVVLEIRDILDKGQRVGVVLSLGHAFSGEPGNGVASGVMVFECNFELHDKVGEGSYGNNSTRDSVLSEGGCPSEG